MNEQSAIATITDPENPTIKRWQTEAPALLTSAEQLTIVDDAGLVEAAEMTKLTTTAIKGIKALFVEPKRSLDRAKQQVMSIERALLAGFERADVIFRAKVTAYHVEREEQRKAEQRRLVDEARAREASERLDDAVRLENLAEATGDEHYRKIADQVLDHPRPIGIAITPPALKPKGISFPDDVDVEIFDTHALIAAVASGRVVLDELTAIRMANSLHSWLKAEAKQRGAAFDVPGVKRIVRPGIRVRS